MILFITSCVMSKETVDEKEQAESIEKMLDLTEEYEVEEILYLEEPHSVEGVLVEAKGVTYEEAPLEIIEVSNNRVSSSTTSGGHVAYKIPTEMSVRSTYQVIVRISKSKVHIYENLNGVVMTSTIPITQTMEVKVIDPSPTDRKMFEIIPDNKPIQLVENNEDVTQWTFNVTPLKTGKSKLKVVISIIKDGHTKEVVYEDNVTVIADVTKTIPFFIANYWQWLITTLIIPFIIWFVKNRKKKKDEVNKDIT